MEVSSVFVNRFQSILSLPSPPSALPSTTLKPKNSQSSSPTIVTPTRTPIGSRVSTTIPSNSYGAPRNAYFSSSKDPSMYYKARRSAILDLQQSSDLDSALARSGGMLRVQDFNVVLRHFGKLNKWGELSQLFDWMRKNGKISFTSYSSYIKFMGKSLNPGKALEIYNGIKDEPTRTNVSVCNSVLSCLVRNGKFESSIKLFNQMKREGLIPDIVTYSTLLAGCTKVKDGFAKAVDLVEEIKYNGLQMDSVIYGALLSVCGSNNRCREAENYFNQMKDEGHSPNVFHYSSLLNAYSADGNYKKADQLVEQMKCAGLVPNKVILTTLLKVYVRGGLFEKSRELLNELVASGYAEDEMPYCLLMDSLAKAGRIHEAKSVFDEMNQRQVKTDGYSYSIMISAFCRSGLLAEAKQFSCDFEAKHNRYDVVILNTILCAYCRAGEMENVMKIMRKMDELTISPDRNTFHILIKYFCKEKLYLLAYCTMEDMHRKGHQLEEIRSHGQC